MRRLVQEVMRVEWDYENEGTHIHLSTMMLYRLIAMRILDSIS